MWPPGPSSGGDGEVLDRWRLEQEAPGTVTGWMVLRGAWWDVGSGLEGFGIGCSEVAPGAGGVNGSSWGIFYLWQGLCWNSFFFLLKFIYL